MMRYVVQLLIVTFLTAASLFHDGPRPVVEQEKPVAQEVKNGVEVRINQIQLQRLGPEAREPEMQKLLLKLLSSHKPEFRRTIAISISQKGQGTTVGPTHIELRSGEVVRPFLHTNQRLMSGIANAKIPAGFDFAECWFQVPADAALANIFPITVFHTTTNAEQDSVKFKFESIEP